VKPGVLAYPQYARLKRYAMTRIAAKEHGHIDTSRDWEYTDWAAVDAFADEFAGCWSESEFARSGVVSTYPGRTGRATGRSEGARA
jgi:hypothetical protein